MIIQSLKRIHYLISKERAEYQTFRLFAILGALTLLFVLIVRIVQYGPNPAAQNRVPTSQPSGAVLESAAGPAIVQPTTESARQPHHLTSSPMTKPSSPEPNKSQH